MAPLEPPRRSRTFFYARVTVLLLVLVGIGVWAWQREQRRSFRRAWQAPLAVAVVLVSKEPAPAATVEAWRRGLSSLQEWTQAEFERYRGRAFVEPVTWTLAQPVVSEPPPLPPEGQSLAERAGAAVEFERAARALDEQAGLGGGEDVVLYVLLEPQGEATVVEGVAERDGRRGVVRASLDDVELGLELAAAAHELLHCLGATDKYGPDGRAQVPEGLAEPDLQPRFPQAFGEVMVGEVPLSESDGRPVRDLAELRVGPTTAREVAWTP